VFEYFPGNYVWNLGVVAAMNSGGLIDEVDRACRPIRESAARGADAGTPEFLRAWTALTDQLVAQAEEAEKARHARTAGQLYFRATNYLCQAERMLANSDPDRIPTYRRVLELAQKAFDLRDPQISRDRFECVSEGGIGHETVAHLRNAGVHIRHGTEQGMQGAEPSILSVGAAPSRGGGGLPHDEWGGKHQGGVIDGAPFERGVQECPGPSPELVAG
jgi:hypothetical protein